MDGPAGVKKWRGQEPNTRGFIRESRVSSPSATHNATQFRPIAIELLARAVVLVPGMNLPEADRATGMSRLLAAVGKEAQRAGRDLDRAETLALISGLTE